MKKVLSLTFALILIVISASFALSADTTIEGEFKIQSWAEWNFDKKFNDIYDEQFDSWFEQRFRLTITHTSSEYLKAVVQIDLVEDTWGQGRAMYINNSTSDYINWAYLDFTVPSIGNFRVGKFPVTWGHGLTMSWEHPAPEGLEWSNAWGPLSLTLLYLKAYDNVINSAGSREYNWDTNIYGARLAYTPAENHLIELFGAYVQSDEFWEPWTGNNYGDADFGIVALAYTGNIADMIDLKFEGSYIFGDGIDNGTGVNYDIEGYSIYADVSYYNDLYRIGLAFLMKSGDWNRFLPTDLKVNFCGFDEAFSWANIIGGDGGGMNSVYSNWEWWAGDMLQNITSIKLYFEICPMDKLTINAAVLYAWTTEDVGSGSRAYGHPAEKYSNHAINAWYVHTSDFGWEVDLGFSYEIMEGLTYTFAGGVLFTGDAWDYEPIRGEHKNWGEIWSISNTLLYEF